MNNEFLKMQKLAGLITESQYKEKLNEISHPEEIESFLNGMIDSSIPEDANEGEEVNGVWEAAEYTDEDNYDVDDVMRFKNAHQYILKNGGTITIEGNPDVTYKALKNGDIEYSMIITLSEDIESGLSTKTLASYKTKASDASKQRNLPTSKVDNRYAGVSRVDKILSFRDEEIDNETIMNKVKAIKPLFSGLNYPDSVIVNFVQTHFNDIVGFSDEEIMDEFKEFITINFEENMNEGMILEAKKSEIDKKLAEIDKEGKITTLEAKIAAIDEVIEAKNSRINMVQEDENLSELIDKKRVKEMQNEIKLLEKSKKLYKKQLDKANGKKEDKKEIVDEQSTESYQSPSIDYTI